MQKQDRENLLDTHKVDGAGKIIQTSQLSSAVFLPLRIRLLFLLNKYSEALDCVKQILHDNPGVAAVCRWMAEISDDGFHRFSRSIKCSIRTAEIRTDYAEVHAVCPALRTMTSFYLDSFFTGSSDLPRGYEL